uniref:Orf245 n=1 Tax=Amoebidium parasiticum TaxID=4881 RepID=Q8M0C9_AMOPA|nr:Orf245 [Amoebidium parasiticum]
MICWICRRDGSWNVDGNRVNFIIRQKDPRGLHFIRKHLGFGRIILAKDGYYNFTVTNASLSKRLVPIFNGNLVLKKTINRYKAYHEALAMRFTDLPAFNSNRKLPSLLDGWLSGFTQADGGFSVVIQKRKAATLGYRVRLKYYVDQKNESEMLQAIRNLFNTGSVVKRSGPPGMKRYEIYSNTAVITVINYFTAHPVFFDKHIAFIKWVKIYYIIKKSRLTQTNLDKILKLENNVSPSQNPRLKI